MSQNAVCAQKACCVPGCLITKEDGVPLHRFPNPEKNPEKFDIWITNIGGELTTLDVATICNNRRICHHHFKDVHKYPKDRLCQLATPVLNLPELGAIEKEATDTADLLLFFDDVFDSVNGSYSDVKSGKIYRAAVTPTSPHHKLWNESLKVLKTMKFENAQNQGVVPSLSSWIKTLENFKNLTKYLSAKGITSLLLRNINQDPLENFFGSVQPTASAFESAFNTLLVNNISSPHSVGANCEKDENFCLNSLKKYLTTEAEDNQTTECECEIDGAHLYIEFINIEELLKSTSPAHIEKPAKCESESRSKGSVPSHKI